MPGLRIYHPTVRTAVVMVPLPPKAAGGSAKEVQITVDSTGHALVSEGVWRELEFALTAGNNAGFIIINEVDNPPTLLLSQGETPDSGRPTYRVEREALREIAPVGVNVKVVESGLFPPRVES